MKEITSYPLVWPSGWRRLTARKEGRFHSTTSIYNETMKSYYRRPVDITIAEGTKRVLAALSRMGIPEWKIIISSNLVLRNDGLPRSNQPEPKDPGIAVYWKDKKDQQKVMAIDLYDRVADNLAAIAATIEAMRAIERHGGATIMDRAFTGFTALPAPNTWRSVLGFTEDDDVTLQDARDVYRNLSFVHHPDKGGSESKMKELNWAIEEAEKQLG